MFKHGCETYCDSPVLEHGFTWPVQTDALANAVSSPAETQAKTGSLKPVVFPIPTKT